MLRKIRLYGNLAQKYGEEFSFDVKTVGESLVALNANFPGFLEDIRGGAFHVVKGDMSDPLDLGKNKAMLLFEYPDDDPFHIIPAIEGSGGDNGWFTLIAGVVLIAVTWGAATPGVLSAEGLIGAGGAVYEIGIGLGVALALTGVSQLLSPTPQMNTTGAEREDDKPSFLFNGPVNRTEQGGPITLVYGEIVTGSIVAGGSIDIEEY